MPLSLGRELGLNLYSWWCNWHNISWGTLAGNGFPLLSFLSKILLFLHIMKDFRKHRSINFLDLFIDIT